MVAESLFVSLDLKVNMKAHWNFLFRISYLSPPWPLLCVLIRKAFLLTGTSELGVIGRSHWGRCRRGRLVVVQRWLTSWATNPRWLAGLGLTVPPVT